MSWRGRSRGVLAGGAAVALAGCLVGPDYQPPKAAELVPERFAEAADMDVYRTGIDIDIAAPHPDEQHITRPDPTGFLHKGREQSKLCRAKF